MAGGGSKAPGDGHVKVSTFAAPVTKGRTLVNYVFVDLQLDAAPGQDAQAMQAYEPILRDAFVRHAHRTPIPHQGYVKLDEAALVGMALSHAKRLYPGKFVSASVRKQVPRRTSGLPTT